MVKMKFKFAIVLLLVSSKLLGQSDNYVGEFNPYVQFKQVEASKVKVRLLARDYFELREIAKFGLRIEVTTLRSKNGQDSYSGKKRIFYVDTARTSDWNAAKSNPNIATIAQLKFGTVPVNDSTELSFISSQYKYQNNLYALSLLACSYSWEAAKLAAAGFELPLSKDSMYLITLSMRGNSNFIKNKEVDVFYANKLENNPNSINGMQLFANRQDRRIELQWMEEPHFISYDILRSEKKNGPFIKRNALPFSNGLSSDSLKSTPMNMYLDSTEKNYKIYHYKLVGYDLFGEKEDCSSVYASYSIDATPPIALDTIGSTSKSENHVRLSWPIVTNPEVDKIHVYFSNGVQGPWRLLKSLKPTVSSYVHDSADNILENYYVVALVDTAGNEGKHLPKKVLTKDTVAPAMVEVASGYSDSLGKVVVRWKRSKSRDIRGYRVAFSNRLDGSYSSQNGIFCIDTFYRDSVNLKILKKGFYFKVQAIDYKNNIGKYSQAFLVEIPDVVPPAMPRIQSVKATNTGLLEITTEFSKQEDVVACCIRRIEESSKDTSSWCFIPFSKADHTEAKVSQFRSSDAQMGNAKKIVSNPKNVGAFRWGVLKLDTSSAKSLFVVVDSSVAPTQLYKYEVCLVDKAGNVSTESIPVSQRAVPPILSMESIQWKVESYENQFARISWDNLPPSAYVVMVYRRSTTNSEAPFQYLTTAKASAGFWIDRSVKQDFYYDYCLVLGDKFGSLSNKSALKSFQLMSKK